MNRAARAFVLAISVSAIMAGVVLGKAGGVAAIPLNNEQETTGATGGASGFFSYWVDGNQLCYTLEVRNLTEAPFGAHIHVGDRGVAGGIVVGLTTPPAATSTVSGCITAVAIDLGTSTLSTAELAAIVADPGHYYVNVHTTMFPGGEIRGQLK